MRFLTFRCTSYIYFRITNQYKMKKLLFPILLFGNIVFSQVGIETDTPQTTLDIDGDVNVSGSIYIGGENISAGNNNQLITSGGDSAAASWTDKTIPLGMDSSLNTSFMNSYKDSNGVEFDNSSAGHTEPYALNDLLDSSVGWKELTDLESQFTISKSENRVNLFFQTMVQFQGSSLASYACGYFINDDMTNRNNFRLKGVRTGIMLPPSGSFNIFNKNSTTINLAPETYTVKIACIKRNISGDNKISIGKPLTDDLNSYMSESTLNITVLEAY